MKIPGLVKVKNKCNIVTAWVILITLAVLYFFFQWFNYKEHGYVTDYAVQVYFNEREINVEEKHQLIVETIEDLNLNKNLYDPINEIFNIFLDKDLSEKNLVENLTKIFPKRVTKEQVYVVLHKSKTLQKNFLNRKMLTNELVRKLNKGEKNKGEYREEIEQLLLINKK